VVGQGIDLRSTDEVHFQRYGSRCLMWVPPEEKDPVLLHHPTRKSGGYFGAVRLRDGKLVLQREEGRFKAVTFHTFLKNLRKVRSRSGRRVVVITENALVLCVDEKSQCQALERSQPTLPLGFGYAEGYTHDYLRHGTLTLFAALDVATGGVLAQPKKRHRHQELLQFLRHIDANVPPGLDVHIIMDNYATHKHERVRSWFARKPRYHVHFTPTYSSWLNQVETWFGIITRKAIRRGSFRSTKELAEKIDLFVKNHNRNSKPFVWTATAESIFEKLERLCKTISVTEH